MPEWYAAMVPTHRELAMIYGIDAVHLTTTQPKHHNPWTHSINRTPVLDEDIDSYF